MCSKSRRILERIEWNEILVQNWFARFFLYPHKLNFQFCFLGFSNVTILAGIHLFKFNNGNNRKMWRFLKLTLRHQKYVNDVVLVSLLLTLNIWCLYCWLRTRKCWLVLYLYKPHICQNWNKRYDPGSKSLQKNPVRY